MFIMLYIIKKYSTYWKIMSVFVEGMERKRFENFN